MKEPVTVAPLSPAALASLRAAGDDLVADYEAAQTKMDLARIHATASSALARSASGGGTPRTMSWKAAAIVASRRLRGSKSAMPSVSKAVSSPSVRARTSRVCPA